MSENSQLAQMAERLKQNADVQRMHTEKIVRDEFEKLRNVIVKESESAAIFYSTAIKKLHRRHWAWELLSKLQWLSAFAIGCALTAWLCLGTSYGIYSKSSGKLPVQTYTVPAMGSGWVMCSRPAVVLQGGQTACKVAE